MSRSGSKVATSVEHIGFLFFAIVALIVFFSPLIIGLLVYFNFNDIGMQSAKFFVDKVGYSITTFSLENYYTCLYRLIGASLLTFVPLSTFGLVYIIFMVGCNFGRIKVDEEDLPYGFPLFAAAAVAIAISIIYWWMITREAPIASYETIMSTAGAPMHWGYRWLFYLFPLISIVIESIALMIPMGFDISDRGFLTLAIVLVGAGVGVGLIALLYFTFIKIIIFLASVIGGLFIIAIIAGVFMKQERTYTDSSGHDRKYHEDFFGDATIEEEDLDSWKGYDGD